MKGFKGVRWISVAAQKVKRFLPNILPQNKRETHRETAIIPNVVEWIRVHKFRILSAIGAVGLTVAVTLTGHHYVKSNTFEVYHVYVDGQSIGTVSNPAILSDYIKETYERIREEHPDVHMVLETGEVTYEAERAFKAQSDDEAALAQLDTMMSSHAVGVEVVVDGEWIGIVKDQETADQILQQIKDQYVPGKSSDNSVMVLGAGDEGAKGSKAQEEMESIDFVEEVTTAQITTDPERIMDPDEVMAKLQEGQVQGMTYTIQKGDTIYGLAQKLGFTEEYIYAKNPEVKDSVLQIGQELNLTEIVPKLSVETILTRVEDHAVHYETIYKTDATLKLGRQVVEREGKQGKKRVTFRITQVNGEDKLAEVIGETIIVEPVPAIIRKGTKVIPGEGTGKFAWPVVGAKITSGYGKRWGTIHKGVDLVSKNRNILASDNGKVTFAGVKSGYGNCVIIDHNNGFQTLYAHLSTISVKKGTTVEKGEKIGVMGSTGNSTGVHLHFEIIKSGTAQNPMTYLKS